MKMHEQVQGEHDLIAEISITTLISVSDNLTQHMNHNTVRIIQ